ncbi:MAG: hypothetical protein WCC04_06560 [Terriglobales bacterium]
MKRTATSLRGGDLQACARFLAIIVAAVLLLAAASGTAAAEVKASGDNYLLATSTCDNILRLQTSVRVTQDMVALVTPGNIQDGGFGVQLNAIPPPGQPAYWMQYVMFIQNNQIQAVVEYWFPPDNGPDAFYTILDLPSNTIYTGSVLSIQLTNDSNGNVTKATFSFTDPTGHVTKLQAPPINLPNTSTPALVPVQSFGVNVVGPINSEGSTFSSGKGVITYKASNGPLSVPATGCSGGNGPGTNEWSNIYYGSMTPKGSSVTQAFAPFAGPLASNMDSANKQLQVYTLGTDQNTHYNFTVDQFAFNGATWSSTDLGNLGAPLASQGSPVISYEYTIYDTTEAFYLTSDAQDVEQLWGYNWAPNNLTVLANAQPATVGSRLVGYIDPIAVSDNVFYQGTDQHVHLLTWSEAGGWTEDTRLAHAPAAAFASALTGHMTAAAEEIFFVGTNNHVYQLWRWSKNYDGWHVTDVTIANGTKPLAAAGSPLAGFYDPAAGTDAVLYVGTNHHVYELLFSPSSVWSSIDVTGQSGAPNAIDGSMLAAHLNTSANSEEVFFVAGGGPLQELWSWSKTVPAWNTYPLDTAVAPETASPLATDMDSLTSPSRDEVYYVGTDGSVHEMWSSSDSGGWIAATP